MSPTLFQTYPVLKTPDLKYVKSKRITSIDLVRGIVMVLMALDHVRDYFHTGYFYGDPTDLETTTPILFLTRWITHFCAPAFIFLAGTSSFLFGAIQNSKYELSKFLFTRGLWLIFIEFTIVNFAWFNNPKYTILLFGVIWVIGLSMIFLAVFIHFPKYVILILGLILVFGHNLLDNITAEGTEPAVMLWYLTHQQAMVMVNNDQTALFFMYPAVPWVGVMMLGYCFGYFYRRDYDAQKRKKWLMVIGLGCIVLFLVLRLTNIYGEFNPWNMQKNIIYTIMSILNTSKYPPSLLYLLMTLGPVILLLSFIENIKNKFSKFMLVFGRVPFFYYILHLYLIHALAYVGLAIQGVSLNELILSAERFGSGYLADVGFDLWVVYVVWIAVIILLYPVCKKYMYYKLENKDKWWLSYL
ncbi:heparan-alpha-glucosaminide N-acetyltransferase domain-containing protein [soil metagenome]